MSLGEQRTFSAGLLIGLIIARFVSNYRTRSGSCARRQSIPMRKMSRGAQNHAHDAGFFFFFFLAKHPLFPQSQRHTPTGEMHSSAYRLLKNHELILQLFTVINVYFYRSSLQQEKKETHHYTLIFLHQRNFIYTASDPHPTSEHVVTWALRCFVCFSMW